MEAKKPRKPRRVKQSPCWLAEIARRLEKEYGTPRHHNPEDPLDDLIFIVLSRMTQEVKYLRTYRALREQMPTWEMVCEAPPDNLEVILADAGLSRIKTQQIRGILQEIERREGRLDLTHLRQMCDEDVERYLTSLPGVSRKTARCVMLYTLGRQVLPVDAHVWRIAKRLGLVANLPWSEKGGRVLEGDVPAQMRPALHVTLIAHGRAVCRAPSPLCGRCVIADLCPSAASDLDAGARVR